MINYQTFSKLLLVVLLQLAPLAHAGLQTFKEKN